MAQIDNTERPIEALHLRMEIKARLLAVEGPVKTSCLLSAERAGGVIFGPAGDEFARFEQFVAIKALWAELILIEIPCDQLQRGNWLVTGGRHPGPSCKRCCPNRWVQE